MECRYFLTIMAEERAFIGKLVQQLLNTPLDLSQFCAASSARLSHFPFESDGAFHPSAEWRRRGL